MTLDFNTITDERGEEIAELFDAYISNPLNLQYTNGQIFNRFVQMFIDTPEELVLVTKLFVTNQMF